MDIFSERFKLLKDESNLTYQQIADALDLKIRVVKGYASGETKPSYSALIALADFLDVSLDFLTGRTVNKNSHKIK